MFFLPSWVEGGISITSSHGHFDGRFDPYRNNLATSGAETHPLKKRVNSHSQFENILPSRCVQARREFTLIDLFRTNIAVFKIPGKSRSTRAVVSKAAAILHGKRQHVWKCLAKSLRPTLLFPYAQRLSGACWDRQYLTSIVYIITRQRDTQKINGLGTP